MRAVKVIAEGGTAATVLVEGWRTIPVIDLADLADLLGPG